MFVFVVLNGVKDNKDSGHANPPEGSRITPHSSLWIPLPNCSYNGKIESTPLAHSQHSAYKNPPVANGCIRPGSHEHGAYMAREASSKSPRNGKNKGDNAQLGFGF